MDFVRDLVGDRHDVGGVFRQRRFRHQDDVVASLEAPDDFRGRLAPRELAKEFLDVLDFKGALFESVLLDEVFHRRLLRVFPGRNQVLCHDGGACGCW